MTRRLCNHPDHEGPRWRLWVDFAPHRRDPDGTPHFHSYCRACESRDSKQRYKTKSELTMRIACPICKAAPKQPCIGAKGPRVRPHRQRRELVRLPVKGKKRSAQQRRNISQARIEQSRETLTKLEPIPSEGHRKCKRCGERKYFNTVDLTISDFPRNRRFVQSTEEWVYYCSSECKACMADRARKRREKLTPEQLRDQDRRHKANVSVEVRRRYSRESARRAARARGVPERGPWKKYRDKPVSAAFIRQFLQGRIQLHTLRAPAGQSTTALGQGAREAHLPTKAVLADIAGLSVDQIGDIYYGKLHTIPRQAALEILRHYDRLDLEDELFAQAA